MYFEKRMTEKELHILIKRCLSEEKEAQKKLFVHMYNYGMSVACQYTSSYQDAEEMTSESFYKMFKNLKSYKKEIPFRLWLRKIVINACIDNFRKNKKRIEGERQITLYPVANIIEEKFEEEYLVSLLRKLSTQYRLVFVLHVIEGYTHDEIAQRLNISKGTSKSNLSKARVKLQFLLTQNQKKIEQYG